MFCPKCGTNVDDSFNFCFKCGFDFSAMKNVNDSNGDISKNVAVNKTVAKVKSRYEFIKFDGSQESFEKI